MKVINCLNTHIKRTFSETKKYLPIGIMMLIVFVACKSSFQPTQLLIESNYGVINENLKIKIKKNKGNKSFYLFNKVDRLSYYSNKNTFTAIFTSKRGDTIHENHSFIDDFRIFDKSLNWDSIKIEKERNLQVLKQKRLKLILNEGDFFITELKLNKEDKNDYSDSEVEFVFEKGEKYFIQLSYTSDSTFVKQNISKELLDSLHKNNIKIFHGTIYSNKVPLKFEK